MAGYILRHPATIVRVGFPWPEFGVDLASNTKTSECMRPEEETSNSPCGPVSGLILLRTMWLTSAAFAFSVLAGAPSPAAAAPTYHHLMSFGKSSAYPQSGLTEGA